MDQELFINRIKRRLAQTAVTSSALRNQGASEIISTCRTFLEDEIELAEFFSAIQEESTFKNLLDEKTNLLMSKFPGSNKNNWGASRKAINLYFRELVYNKSICDHFNVPRDSGEYNTLIQFLEVPLDKFVALALYNLDKQLPKWNNIRDLKHSESDKYQHFAQAHSTENGYSRVHLDLEYWRVRKN